METFALNKTLCRKEKNVPAHFNQSFGIKTIDRVHHLNVNVNFAISLKRISRPKSSGYVIATIFEILG